MLAKIIATKTKVTFSLDNTIYFIPSKQDINLDYIKQELDNLKELMSTSVSILVEKNSLTDETLFKELDILAIENELAQIVAAEDTLNNFHLKKTLYQIHELKYLILDMLATYDTDKERIIEIKDDFFNQFKTGFDTLIIFVDEMIKRKLDQELPILSTPQKTSQQKIFYPPIADDEEFPEFERLESEYLSSERHLPSTDAPKVTKRKHLGTLRQRRYSFSGDEV